MIEKAKSILAENNFPPKFIDRIISEKLNHVNLSNETIRPMANSTRTGDITLNHNGAPIDGSMNTTELSIARNDKFAALTYVPIASEALTRHLKYFVPEVKIASKPGEKNGRFFINMKYRIKNEDKSGCIYQVPCADCDQVYIGETQQKLGMRMKQHKYDVEKKKKDSTALAAHSKTKDTILTSMDAKS